MSINRKQRRKVADNLAAFMRGEITCEQYLDHGLQIRIAIKNSNNPDKFALYNAAFEWMNTLGHDTIISTDETTWQAMCRRLAFLESDLEMKREGHDVMPGLGVWGVLACIVAVTCLGCLYYACLGVGLGLFLVLWAGIGLVAGLARDIHARLHSRKKPSDPFHPFNNEQQFDKHRHLLDHFRLPTYDPSIAQQSSEARYPILVTILGGVWIFLRTVPQNVIRMILGPLMLIASLKPEQCPRYVAVKGDES